MLLIDSIRKASTASIVTVQVSDYCLLLISSIRKASTAFIVTLDVSAYFPAHIRCRQLQLSGFRLPLRQWL